MSGRSPSDIVIAFCDAWQRLDIDEIAGFLHEDIFYHNMPMAPIEGKAAVVDYLRQVGPFDSCIWEMVNIAADGQTVLTERVDRFVMKGTEIALELMGVFEIEDELIRVWRDYFDLAGYRSQLPS